MPQPRLPVTRFALLSLLLLALACVRDAEAHAASALAPDEPAAPSVSPGHRERLADLSRRLDELTARVDETRMRLGLLGEQALGKLPGPRRARIVHKNEMGSALRPVRVAFAVDGAELMVRADEHGVVAPGAELAVWEGPLPPGNHTLTVAVTYRGHDGFFTYVEGYAVTAKASHTFTVADSGTTRVTVVGRPRGSALTTTLLDRAALDVQVAIER